MTDGPPPGLPVTLRVAGRRVVVVGGGARAHRRVAALVLAGGRVTVVSPEVTPALEAVIATGSIGLVPRAYLDGDLAGAWLGVAATGDPVVDEAVLAEADRRGVLGESVARPDTGSVVLAPVVPAPGTSGRAVWSRPGVALVGGGPGDPGLLTVRARQLLADADVVVVDHLAPQSVLAGLSPGVLVVDASKLPRGHAMAQDAINDELVAHATAGRRVVRLKGGDPFVFGRGMEELEACVAAGVEVEVVPGVSSATGVPGLAGIPVTHRGVTHEFVVVSGHLAPDHPDSLVDWAALGRLRGTLVVLMGVRTAGALADRLVAEGRPASTPVAVIEDGGGAQQRVTRTTLGHLGAHVVEEGVRAPAVWVAGEVVALSAPP